MCVNMDTCLHQKDKVMDNTTLTEAQCAQLRDTLEQRKEQLLTELGQAKHETRTASAERVDRETGDDLLAQADRIALDTVRDAEATRDHDELVAVRAALARMAEGSYGECTDCGQPVGASRLLAQPSAARCIECQSRAEAQGLR